MASASKHEEEAKILAFAENPFQASDLRSLPFSLQLGFLHRQFSRLLDTDDEERIHNIGLCPRRLCCPHPSRPMLLLFDCRWW